MRVIRVIAAFEGRPPGISRCHFQGDGTSRVTVDIRSTSSTQEGRVSFVPRRAANRRAVEMCGLLGSKATVFLLFLGLVGALRTLRRSTLAASSRKQAAISLGPRERHRNHSAGGNPAIIPS